MNDTPTSYATAFDNGFYKGHEDAFDVTGPTPAAIAEKLRAWTAPSFKGTAGDLVDSIGEVDAADQLGISVTAVRLGRRIFRDACASWDLGYKLGVEAVLEDLAPEIAGEEAGIANVEVVLGEHGAEAVIGTLAPDQDGWQVAAIAVAAHTFVLGSEEWDEDDVERYYRAYAAGARRRAEQVRDEQAPIAAVG